MPIIRRSKSKAPSVPVSEGYKHPAADQVVVASGDLQEAFESLLGELERLAEHTRREGAEAFRTGALETVDRLRARAEGLKRLADDIRTKQEELDALLKTTARVGTTVTAPPRASRRRRRKRPRAGIPPGLKTPQKAYRLPILRVLITAGGEARASYVLDAVHAELADNLRPVDLEGVRSQKGPRWLVSARFERLAMVKEGLLRHDSPQGIWAISEQGIDYAEAHPSIADGGVNDTDTGALAIPEPLPGITPVRVEPVDEAESPEDDPGQSITNYVGRRLRNEQTH